jgi:hypothetical protein
VKSDSVKTRTKNSANNLSPVNDAPYDTDEFSDSENYEIFDSDSDLIKFDEASINENLKCVRKIVRVFRTSAVKNDLLQKYVKQEFGHEITLKLDVPTRWNSIICMLDAFFKLRHPIMKTLNDLNLEELIKNVDYALLENLKNSLEPIQLAVENLSRIDATLYSADVVINFMKTKLKQFNHH